MKSTENTKVQIDVDTAAAASPKTKDSVKNVNQNCLRNVTKNSSVVTSATAFRMRSSACLALNVQKRAKSSK